MITLQVYDCKPCPFDEDCNSTCHEFDEIRQEWVYISGICKHIDLLKTSPRKIEVKLNALKGAVNLLDDLGFTCIENQKVKSSGTVDVKIDGKTFEGVGKFTYNPGSDNPTMYSLDYEKIERHAYVSIFENEDQVRGFNKRLKELKKKKKKVRGAKNFVIQETNSGRLFRS